MARALSVIAASPGQENPAGRAVAFSPDGKMVGAASTDGTVQLWEVATEQESGGAITASSVAVHELAFSPGGRTLATADQDGNVRLWDVAFPAGLLGAACTIADQSLTRQQWADYAGSQPFQQVCPAS